MAEIFMSHEDNLKNEIKILKEQNVILEKRTYDYKNEIKELNERINILEKTIYDYENDQCPACHKPLFQSSAMYGRNGWYPMMCNTCDFMK